MSRLLLFFVYGLFVLLILFSRTSERVMAHPKSKPGALSLPSCTARLTSCQEPADPVSGLPDRHCVDGFGTPRSCADIRPFRYLPIFPAARHELSNDGKSPPDQLRFTYVSQQPVFDAPCQNGLAADQYDCENIDLLAYLPVSDNGGGGGSDMWGWTDPELGNEYVIMGRTSGVSFFAIDNPTAPLYIGNLPTNAVSSLWRDLKVYQNHLYVVSDKNLKHGMQVFDLTELRGVTTTQEFRATHIYTGLGSAHNIAINSESGYAYALAPEADTLEKSCNQGMHMIDIRNPASPQYAGCYGDIGYIHDVQCVMYRGPDLAYNGREICFASNADTNTDTHALAILDVTDKDKPKQLSWVTEPGFYYFHQGWLTEDQHYFLSNDELDELDSPDGRHNARTYVWDVSDLRHPTVIGSFTSSANAIDHNLYIRGSYVFEANYTSGLRILELANVSQGQLTEVAYFDTFVPDTPFEYDGAWSAFPYFQSGTVAVSAMDGLYLVRPALPPEFSAIAVDNVLDYCTSDNPSGSYGAAVRVDAFNMYEGTVQLRVADQEDASFIGLSQETVALGNLKQAFVDVSIVDGIAPGLREFSIVVSDGDKSQSVAMWLDMASSVPAAPSAISLSGTATLPILGWTAVAEASSYKVEVATSAEFQDVVLSYLTDETEITLWDELDDDKEYFWRITALNACGNGIPSAVQRLSTSVIAPAQDQLTYLPFY